jgi:hypothetical protein
LHHINRTHDYANYQNHSSNVVVSQTEQTTLSSTRRASPSSSRAIPKENTITQRSSPSQRPRTLRLIKTVLVKSGLIFSESAPSPPQTPSNVGVTHILPNMHILIPLRHALLRLELILLQQQLQENLQHIAPDRSARAGVHAVPEIERLARGGSPFVLSRRLRAEI